MERTAWMKSKPLSSKNIRAEIMVERILAWSGKLNYSIISILRLYPL